MGDVAGRGVGGLRWKVMGVGGARFVPQTGQSSTQAFRIAFVWQPLLKQNTPAEWQFDELQLTLCTSYLAAHYTALGFAALIPCLCT